jgi:penicillin-binding protein 2
MFYGGKFQCTGYHTGISVRRAIEVSCNVYFYEVSRQLGIDNITKYAELYGLGSPLGLETGDAGGFLCNPETFAERGQTWYIGYVIQAGIGNQDCGFTPLQLANVASTIGNRGVRYKPYLVDSLYNYGTKEITSKTKPTVAEKIELNNDYVYDYIIGGMIDASRNVPSPYGLTGFGFDVAIKTGTPQTDMSDLRKQNSVFIGFAPAHDPQIAFAGVIEGGEYSKYMVHDIIDAYEECFGFSEEKKAAELTPEVRDGTTAKTTTVTTTSTGTGTSTTNTNSTTTVTVAAQ